MGWLSGARGHLGRSHHMHVTPRVLADSVPWHQQPHEPCQETSSVPWHRAAAVDAWEQQLADRTAAVLRREAAVALREADLADREC